MSEQKIISEALKVLNASPNAIRFFSTSYRAGSSSIGQIAKLSSMDRSSAYIAFDALKGLGLVDEELTGGRKVVVARPPKAVIARLRTEIRKMRRHVDAIEEGMPGLMAEYANKEDKPILQMFSGADGLGKIKDDVLTHAEDEILLMSNLHEEAKAFTNHEHQDFIRRRVESGVSLRLLATDSSEAHAIKLDDKINLRETRIVIGDEPFKNETYIYGDSIAMVSYKENVGIVGFIVRSKEFAEAQRWMFEEIWNKYEQPSANSERADN